MKLNIIFIVIIIGLAVYMVFGHNGLLKYRDLVRIKNNYELQLHTTQDKVKALETDLKRVQKNVDYLEMLIKKELNMKKPGEDLYIIEKKDKDKDGDSSPDKKSDSDDKSE